MEEILILCIGDSKLIGDSLGPLIGSFLERNKSDIGNNVKVLGTLEKPIGYNDLIEIAKHINYNKEYYTTIITIDSALGSNQNIGKILIDNTTLCAGSGVNTGEKLIGDISIRYCWKKLWWYKTKYTRTWKCFDESCRKYGMQDYF